MKFKFIIVNGKYFQILKDYTIIPLSQEETSELLEKLSKSKVTSEIHGYVDNYLTNGMIVNFGSKFQIIIDGYDKYFGNENIDTNGYTLYWLIQSYVTEHLDKYEKDKVPRLHAVLKSINLKRNEIEPKTKHYYGDLKNMPKYTGDKIMQVFYEEFSDKCNEHLFNETKDL